MAFNYLSEKENLSRTKHCNRRFGNNARHGSREFCLVLATGSNAQTNMAVAVRQMAKCAVLFQKQECCARVLSIRAQNPPPLSLCHGLSAIFFPFWTSNSATLCIPCLFFCKNINLYSNAPWMTLGGRGGIALTLPYPLYNSPSGPQSQCGRKS
jgi:hypothetical protein